MPDAIVFENLSKCYNVKVAPGTSVDARRTLLGGAIIDLASSQKNSSSSGKRGELWAVRDMSFAIEQGDSVGFIGRNGAGKSTLMKIVSRITKPTSGRVLVRGRVGSLLEIGTGFHPELTGRENIFLNGSIMGLSRQEIKRQFDSIVEFSEMEKQLDTPVKFYSSGQYMRLGFAVAAHLNQEILIVDEVLAVGDAAFQEKCRAKMRSLIGAGHTILFVSHDMSLMKEVCRKTAWLNEGRLVEFSDTSEVVAKYESSFAPLAV